MARIPMVGDPKPLRDLLAEHGDPIEAILGIHEDTKRRLTEAETIGDLETAKEARSLLKRTQKTIDDYGLASKR